MTSIEVHLRAAGVLLFALAGMHAFLPRRFAWSEELARLSLPNRQIFVVHCVFIVLVLCLNGVLSACFAPLLLDRSALARVVLAGLATFWGARLAAQFLLYSSKLWRGHKFNTAVHVAFSGLWAYLTAVYAIAWAR